MRIVLSLLLAFGLFLGGCSLVGNPFGAKTETFVVEVCVDGDLTVVPCFSLGEIELPVNTNAFAALAVALAQAYVNQSEASPTCTFASAVTPGPDGAIVATGTATCTLNGVPLSQVVTLSLRPVPATPSPIAAFIAPQEGV